MNESTPIIRVNRLLPEGVFPDRFSHKPRAVAVNGHSFIEKLSAERLHSRDRVFAKVIHKVDTMTTVELKVKSWRIW